MALISIDSFLITWWPWKPVQLDGHLDWVHFDASASQNNCTCSCIVHWHVSFRSRVSKCNQSRWPSNYTGFHGHHVTRNSSISIQPWLRSILTIWCQQVQKFVLQACPLTAESHRRHSSKICGRKYLFPSYDLSGTHRETAIGLASDDVKKLSNAWQQGKLVLNKDRAPYKSMLGEKSLFTGWSSLFLCGEVGTVLTTSSQLSASHGSKDIEDWTSAGSFFGRSTISQHAFVRTLSLFRTNFAGCYAVT